MKCIVYNQLPYKSQLKASKPFRIWKSLAVNALGVAFAKRKEWSLRMLHELTYHPQSSFITLTYDDYHLPSDNSLKKAAFAVIYKTTP